VVQAAVLHPLQPHLLHGAGSWCGEAAARLAVAAARLAAARVECSGKCLRGGGGEAGHGWKIAEQTKLDGPG
jgi:hypothetical protein